MAASSRKPPYLEMLTNRNDNTMMTLYLAAMGKLCTLSGPCIVPMHPSPDEFRIVAFLRGKLATSTYFQSPYLAQYPSYHSWSIEVVGPCDDTGRRRDERREQITLALLKGGSLGQGPILIGSGFAAIVIGDPSDVRLNETLRVLYEAYFSFIGDSEKMIHYLEQESKFIVSLSFL